MIARRRYTAGVVGAVGPAAVGHRFDKGVLKRKWLESHLTEGDRPVRVRKPSWTEFPSTARHVEPGWNPGGPPPKAKYYLATDSELVPRGKGEKHSRELSEIVPETAHLQAIGALCPLKPQGGGGNV